MKLDKIQKITGKIELLSGLHIGSGQSEMHIGGADNPVIKNPVTKQPYIPGSSIKGKMRSLLEWRLGVVGQTEGKPLTYNHINQGKIEPDQLVGAKLILKLFGSAPMYDPDDLLIAEIGPSRLSFWDCNLNDDWVQFMHTHNQALTESKMENTIDRIKGTAEHPRNTERVPAGALFDFTLVLRLHDGENYLQTILQGLKLLELTGLGGSGSRGYGKILFRDLKLDDEPIQTILEQLDLLKIA